MIVMMKLSEVKKTLEAHQLYFTQRSLQNMCNSGEIASRRTKGGMFLVPQPEVDRLIRDGRTSRVKEAPGPRTDSSGRLSPTAGADVKKDRYLKRMYGISLEVFNKLMLLQGERCALCRDEFESPRDIHVDHCHETGQVRGILCASCNLGLGFFKDNTTVLLRAVRYLEA
jgi:hypothetical protein